MMGIVDINHMMHLTFGILSMTGFNSMLKFLVNSLATIDSLAVYAWSYCLVLVLHVCVQFQSITLTCSKGNKKTFYQASV